MVKDPPSVSSVCCEMARTPASRALRAVLDIESCRYRDGLRHKKVTAHDG
jgi:hypothetical protein